MIKIEGLDRVINDFTKASIKVKLGAVEAVRRTAAKIENTAKSLAPAGPRSGPPDLRDSIHTTMVGGAAEIGPSVPWGGFVEYGTYKDQPQPYMWPAYWRHSPELVEELTRLGANI